MEESQQKTTSPPEGYAEYKDDFCSNADGIINYQVAELLKTENIFACYPAWDWFGEVWFDKEKQLYFCSAKRYRYSIGVVSATTPEELKQAACDSWGWN